MDHIYKRIVDKLKPSVKSEDSKEVKSQVYDLWKVQCTRNGTLPNKAFGDPYTSFISPKVTATKLISSLPMVNKKDMVNSEYFSNPSLGKCYIIKQVGSVKLDVST